MIKPTLFDFLFKLAECFRIKEIDQSNVQTITKLLYGNDPRILTRTIKDILYS